MVHLLGKSIKLNQTKQKISVNTSNNKQTVIKKANKYSQTWVLCSNSKLLGLTKPELVIILSFQSFKIVAACVWAWTICKKFMGLAHFHSVYTSHKYMYISVYNCIFASFHLCFLFSSLVFWFYFPAD